MKSLEEITVQGITSIRGKLNDEGDVSFAFSQRLGGVSKAPYASLNLATHVGDKVEDVMENRRLFMDSLHIIETVQSRLLVPCQVHGDTVVVVDKIDSSWVDIIARGADALVVTVPDIPVALMYADCTPVVMSVPGGFCVAHCGWKGTQFRLAAKAAQILIETLGASIGDLQVVIGPRIGKNSYQVSTDLLNTFKSDFGVECGNNNQCLDLAYCITTSLIEIGVDPLAIIDSEIDTLIANNKYFSYRGEHGTCGRHAAIAWMSAIH